MPRWHRPASGPWNGVNLGGWLLLEPGPSEPLFSNQAKKHQCQKADCEWELMQMIRNKKDVRAISRHRKTFITKGDFERIRACGLNAVRLPFGYWCVLGPTGEDPYEGPCLEIIDQALDWAEEVGLQVLLDLHGCPGGESGEPPCGRVNADWHWRQWRVGQSLQALKVLALRYKDRKCVTGIAVCNEPSGDIPAGHILRYYDKAVELVRKCGMRANQVAVVLPAFFRDYDEFIGQWVALTKGRHRNVCFEDHFYQCLDDYAQGLTFAQHLRSVQESVKDLRRYPMVIGEWSLALGQNAFSTPFSKQEIRKQFGLLQIEAYKAASHGWFFWNWKDGAGTDWDFQLAFQEGCFSGPAPVLPPWNGKGEDPLEADFNARLADRLMISFGDAIFLRSTYHGCCMDAEECKVRAKWPDTEDWQRFTLHPPVGASQERRQVLNGDIVRICSHSDRFLYSADDRQLSADKRCFGGHSEFIVRTLDGGPLRHRKAIFLQNRANSCMVDTGDEDDDVRVRWQDKGKWQKWAVEKDLTSPEEAEPGRTLSKRANSRKNALDDSEALVMTPPKAKKQRLNKSSTCENQIPGKIEVQLQVVERNRDKASTDRINLPPGLFATLRKKVPSIFSFSPPLKHIPSQPVVDLEL